MFNLQDKDENYYLQTAKFKQNTLNVEDNLDQKINNNKQLQQIDTLITDKDDKKIEQSQGQKFNKNQTNFTQQDIGKTMSMIQKMKQQLAREQELLKIQQRNIQDMYSIQKQSNSFIQIDQQQEKNFTNIKRNLFNEEAFKNQFKEAKKDQQKNDDNKQQNEDKKNDIYESQDLRLEDLNDNDLNNNRNKQNQKKNENQID
ncbi:hypothetical protein PPERSA_05181 [Pseudocohnilembus persalinus]|uniref:Uncharacterized protein n=1 Tax=Pseudocohnilembus persalinus TaxID=266149 RepID=A0A0V0R9L2_PSEPJ|nr:hypothetical protein PPERSA_05181 [Pseudocohnilembus persalinus]|eukprot:KRX11072.1 hypothetical protein PPERSA_05181 [Pseudocohnilembus persalinus]